jgi:hypothetical protein
MQRVPLGREQATGLSDPETRVSATKNPSLEHVGGLVDKGERLCPASMNDGK